MRTIRIKQNIILVADKICTIKNFGTRMVITYIGGNMEITYDNEKECKAEFENISRFLGQEEEKKEDGKDLL